MSHINPNAAQEYIDRQDRYEARHASQLSIASGRAVDSFGFAVPVPKSDPPPVKPELRRRRLEADRQRKLQVARWSNKFREADRLAHEQANQECSQSFLLPTELQMLTVSELFPETDVLFRHIES